MIALFRSGSSPILGNEWQLAGMLLWVSKSMSMMSSLGFGLLTTLLLLVRFRRFFYEVVLIVCLDFQWVFF